LDHPNSGAIDSTAVEMLLRSASVQKQAHAEAQGVVQRAWRTRGGV
jgi:hypothetical protein